MLKDVPNFYFFSLISIIGLLATFRLIKYFRRKSNKKRGELEQKSKKPQKPKKPRKKTWGEISEERRRIEKYPIIEFTQDEFNKIPKSDSFTIEWLRKESFIGFRFICKPSEASLLKPEIIAMGEVVKGDDLVCEQWGAGLSVPAKGINRYQVRIVS